MKKVNLLLIMFFTLLVSCSSDDNGTNETNEIVISNLIGEWEFDNDPGYGDPTFYETGRVKFHYFKEEWGDNFDEWGDWTMTETNLKIMWDDGGVYDTEVIELSSEKLRWKVMIDGQLSEENYTKK